MRRVVTFYEPETGRMIHTWSGPAADLALNTPPGSAVMEGHHDPDRKRVVDGRVTDRNDAAAGTPRAVTLGAIQAIERGSMRAMRDALLALLPDGPEKTRLLAVEAACAEHRKALR